MTGSRDNIFDVIRIVAAYAVMFSHYHAFVKIPEPMVFGIVSLGTLSVIVFFSISGFLITNSYIKSKSTIDYISKRCKRIFPALFICSVIMIYIICPLFGSGNSIQYISSKNALITFLDYTTLGWVPLDTNGFAKDYMHKNALNGSLWSLGYEFTAYILVMLILFTKKHTQIKMTLAVITCVIVAFICNHTKVPAEIRHFINDHFILFSSVARGSIYFVPFAVGSLLAVTQEKWNSQKGKVILAVTGMIIIPLLSQKNITDTAFFFSIPLIIIPVALSFKDRVIKGRFDISYGVYIYAYPIQQVVANEANLPFFAGMLASMLITSILATASWFLIEKPMIRMK